MKGSGLKLHQGRLRLDIRGEFFTERVVQPWYRLPRKVVECRSLKRFKRHGCSTWGHGLVWLWQSWGNSWTFSSRKAFPT